jgi:hypothetical protein
MDEQNVSISDDALTIENCVINDHDIVTYFENAQNQNKDLDEILENILKLGVIASKSAQVGNQVDFVEKKFMAIQNNLEHQLNEQFGTQGDSIKESMTDMFHKLGVELGINQAIQNEHEKGSQKGLEFEQYCEEYISNIAKQHNDRLEATGSITGIISGSRKGDFVYTVQDSGKKIVLEMKNYSSRQGTSTLEAYMNEAIENRGADYGIVVSKKSSSLAKDIGIFQEYGNKLFVALTTEETDDAELHNELLVIALRWARLRLKQKSGTVDSAMIIEKIENIQRTMKNFSSIKKKCTSIKGMSNEISEDLDELRDKIKADILIVSKSLQQV